MVSLVTLFCPFLSFCLFLMSSLSLSLTLFLSFFLSFFLFLFSWDRPGGGRGVAASRWRTARGCSGRRTGKGLYIISS